MSGPERRALVLAALQAADLAITVVSSKYGDEHLDHLGVPPPLRPGLPVFKGVAVVALVMTAKRPAHRSIVGSVLVSYYSAAAAFHVFAGDSPTEAAPAAACGLLAGTIV